MENPVKQATEAMQKLSVSKAAESKKTSEKPKESYLSREIEVFKDLKRGMLSSIVYH